MMTVSKQTENFIDCMKMMSELYSKVYSSLNVIYDTQNTESIINECFMDEFDALEKRIENLVINSMKVTMSETESGCSKAQEI